MWAQAAFMGLNLVGGFMTSNAQAAASKAQAREGVAQAKAKQEEANANSELARQIKRINNIRMMQAADKNVAAAASNIERMRKDFTQGNNDAYRANHKFPNFNVLISKICLQAVAQDDGRTATRHYFQYGSRRAR